MKELVVCSGKGGTGKTSVIASFAALATDPVLADCDVDAADLHLVIKPSIEQRREFWSGKKAVVRRDDCIGCSTCIDVCRFSAVQMQENGRSEVFSEIDPLSCEGCGVCVRLCPEQAIDFPEAICGEWFLSQTRFGPMVHAQLAVAAENSGKLVSLVRSEAKHIAEERGKALLLVDGPPGIGCPVIASLAGADCALAVTEPTPSGLHDLERIVSLARHFGIPIMVCINKYDLNSKLTERITTFCERENIQVVGNIPDDPSVTAAQLASTSVVERDSSPAARAIRTIWERIEESLAF